MKFIESNLVLWLAASLSLGLAPFTPEPHIWDKLKRVFLHTLPMEPIDWFDLFLHGTPWVLLIVALVLRFRRSLQKFQS